MNINNKKSNVFFSLILSVGSISTASSTSYFNVHGLNQVPLEQNNGWGWSNCCTDTSDQGDGDSSDTGTTSVNGSNIV